MFLSRRWFFLALAATSALLAQHAAPVAAATESSAAEQATTSPTGAPSSAPIDHDEPGGSMTDCNPDYIGDGSCDDSENNEACGYDGGDCCECTCTPDIFNCGGSYNCIDPEAECVGDDDGNGGVETTLDLEDEGIGNEMAEDSASGSAPVVASIILGCAAATGFAALAL